MATFITDNKERWYKNTINFYDKNHADPKQISPKYRSYAVHRSTQTKGDVKAASLTWQPKNNKSFHLSANFGLWSTAINAMLGVLLCGFRKGCAFTLVACICSCLKRDQDSCFPYWGFAVNSPCLRAIGRQYLFLQGKWLALVTFVLYRYIKKYICS